MNKIHLRQEAEKKKNLATFIYNVSFFYDDSHCQWNALECSHLTGNSKSLGTNETFLFETFDDESFFIV